MKKVLHIIGIVLLCFLSDAVLAQTELPLTQKAIELYDDGHLMEAKDQILAALKDPNESKSALTWYTKGFIYKELYIEIDKESKYSEYREISIDAILRSMELDDDNQWIVENKKALKYLSLSYFNNAVDLVYSLTFENHEEAPKFYKRFAQLIPLASPEFNLKEKNTEFYNKYAFELRALSQKGDEQNETLLEKAIRSYETALEYEPNNEIANYNLAVIHYNRAAKKIRSINYQTEIFELITIQDECLQIFKTALPYMEVSHQLEPNNLDALKGLMAINKALNNEALSEEYRLEMERLIKSGKAE